MVLFAFLLKYLSLPVALLCAIGALLNNLFILPRLTAKFYREGQPKDIGIIFYPISVFFVILFFPNHVYLAAALWAIMAFGDGFATIFGKRWGVAKLPWSKDKSWVGSFAYVVFATAGASLLIWWTLHPLAEGESVYFFYFWLPFILSLISSLMESLPFGVNDNLLVPMVGAFTAYIMVTLHYSPAPDWSIIKEHALIGFGITFVFGFLAFIMKLVSKTGFIAGVIAGTIIYVFAGWMGFVLLALFFTIASGLTKFGYKTKESRGLAQEEGGARGTKHVAANVSLPIILAVILFFSWYNPVFAVAFAAALATALSDTSSSEFGQLYGKNTFMITTFRKVPPGTDGAVSVEGTLAGLVGPFIIGAAAYFTGFTPTIWAIFIIGFAGFFGNLVESYMNALVKNKAAADNELMNFLNTVTGAGLAILGYNLIF